MSRCHARTLPQPRASSARRPASFALRFLTRVTRPVTLLQQPRRLLPCAAARNALAGPWRRGAASVWAREVQRHCAAEALARAGLPPFPPLPPAAVSPMWHDQRFRIASSRRRPHASLAGCCDGAVHPHCPLPEAVALLTASSWAQRQAQTQTAAQSDLHHFGWERGGPVRRHCCKPGSRLVAGLGNHQSPLGWFQGRQQHGSSWYEYATHETANRVASHQAQLPLPSRAQARCQ